MTESLATVYVVDDDASIRRAMTRLFRSAGYLVRTFESAGAFLAAPHAGSLACLLLDLRLPGMSGAELQQELLQRSADLPIVILTGHGDVASAVQAMKQGRDRLSLQTGRQPAVARHGPEGDRRARATPAANARRAGV